MEATIKNNLYFKPKESNLESRNIKLTIRYIWNPIGQKCCGLGYMVFGRSTVSQFHQFLTFNFYNLIHGPPHPLKYINYCNRFKPSNFTYFKLSTIIQ